MRRPTNPDRTEDLAAAIMLSGPEPRLAGRINGTNGDDVLQGTDHKDNLYGRGGDDQIFGEGGRDVLVGGAGADRLDGGAGIDVADYGGDAGISIVFDKSGPSTVHVAGDSDDTITSIERINGSDAGDTFDITAAKPKSIYSGNGDDTFYADPLSFDPEDIKISAGDGTDTIDLSRDTAPADYVPDQPLKFYFRFESIDNIIGSRFDDEISLGNNLTPALVHGMNGDDAVFANRDQPTLLFGDAGDDVLIEYRKQGEAHGGVGDNLIAFAFRDDGAGSASSQLVIDGGDGSDTVRYEGFYGVNGYQSITLELGRNGAAGSYTLPDGTTGILRSIENIDESLNVSRFGYPGQAGIASTIYGNEQSNGLIGSVRSDTIAANGRVAPHSNGDTTTDVMTGGHGADTFLITNVTARQGHVIATDRITDFLQSDHDKIDLSQVDAKSKTAALDHFTFIGGDAFTGHAGELRYEIADGVTMVMADTDGDKTADFALRLDGEITLVKADFIL